ncbi:streptothricin acetyltransferase [Streptomyces sp. CB03234]|uniref:GNAT family N-acetyltransferase n=1 Tax=Streptomyces sp. (strain CB03234) TaxID=1703937 RepID=UPI0009402DE6|nr:GNAT family N-acetyltransferase [Streptomyces sp. CB03234]OKK06176.1 streptothricin acetyltransferase [Streptomyces sp. CB03234]
MTTVDSTAYRYRSAVPEDAQAIKALDGSFTTDTVFQVTVTDDGFALREIAVALPLTKVFPEDEYDGDDGDEGDDGDDGDGTDSRTFVAHGAAGDLAGFIAVSYSGWNRRLTIDDIEIDPEHRGRGVGRALMGLAVEFARERGAGHLWLEVTNINAPAIHAYRRMGFAFCGLDTSLYHGTPSEGEQALYMSMPCP